ncbi:MAG: hypothetical protein J4428_04035 [Candidatus Aenigmarchaeota archaeon]|nr:hypothetical protein [Candidatus Aenigmarchaeota archaeon]
MDKVNEIKRFIANKGIEADIIEHKLLGLKSEDAAKATGFYIGNIIKTLLFVSEDNTIVTICLGVDKIDIEKLSGISGLKKPRLATKDELKTILNTKPGGTPPICLPEKTAVLIDGKVLEKNFVIGFGGSEFIGLKIKPNEIVKHSNAKIADITIDCMNEETKTHTALHIVKGATQKVLGTVLTTSVYVDDSNGRLTVQCGNKPTNEEIQRIELEANNCINENNEVKILEIDRKEAEDIFGNIIYDVFPVPSHITKLKILEIENWNINCCNKEHTRTTREVGKIEIDKIRFRDVKQLLEISFKVI